MAGVQLKFDSPSESSVDVDAALLGDDVDTMKKAIRELRRENEDLRAQLAKTQRRPASPLRASPRRHRAGEDCGARVFTEILTWRCFDD